MVVSRAIAVTGIFPVIFGVLIVITGFLYPPDLCFGSATYCGSSGGVLSPVLNLIQETGVSWLTFSVTVTILGLAVLQLGLKGRADLPVVSGLLAIISSLLLVPTVLFGFLGVLSYIHNGASCGAMSFCNPVVPLLVGVLGLAALVMGFSGGSQTIVRRWSRRMPLGLVLGEAAGILAVLSFPSFLQIALPGLDLALISLLFLILAEYPKPALLIRASA